MFRTGKDRKVSNSATIEGSALVQPRLSWANSVPGPQAPELATPTQTLVARAGSHTPIKEAGYGLPAGNGVDREVPPA